MILTDEQVERIVDLMDSADRLGLLSLDDYVIRGELITALFRKREVIYEEHKGD